MVHLLPQNRQLVRRVIPTSIRSLPIGECVKSGGTLPLTILPVAHYHIYVGPGLAPPRFIATRLIFYALPTRFRLHNGRSSSQPITRLPAVCPLFETTHHTGKTEDRPVQSS